MRFAVCIFLTAFSAANARAEGQLAPKQAEDVLGHWFKATCLPEVPANPKMTLVLRCVPRNNPDAAPLMIGAASIDELELAGQLNSVSNWAERRKGKHHKNDWNGVMERHMAVQEHSPAGRLGFYGAAPGLGNSALSFVVVDPTTRLTLQLLYTYRAPNGDVKIDEKATAQSMNVIYDHLKESGFALEKRYWR